MTFHLGHKVHSTSLCLLDEWKHDDLFHILLFVGPKTPNFHKTDVVLSVFGEFSIICENMFSCINYRDSVKKNVFWSVGERWIEKMILTLAGQISQSVRLSWASVRIISSIHKNSVCLSPLWTALSLSSPLASQEVVGARNKLTISHCIVI